MVSFKNQIHTLVLLLTMGITFSALAQNNTFSPYSFAGLGEMDYGHLARNRALSGLAAPLFSNNHYNFVNPASLGFIDKTVFDFGLRGERGTLSTGNSFRDYNNGNFNYFGIGFRILHRKTRNAPDTVYNLDHTIKKIRKSSNLISWGTGFSISPYSSTGGDFQQQYDTSFANSLFINNAMGGLTSVAFNNGIKIGEHISIGYSLAFIWGQNLKTRLVTFPDSQNIFTLQDQRMTEYNGFVHNLGVGFVIPLSEKINISTGISYRLPHSLKNTLTHTVRSFDYNAQGGLVLLDTISFSDNQRGSVKIPAYFTGGIALNIEKIVSIGAEYSIQKWSTVMGEGWNENFADFNRLSIGLTINPETTPAKSMRKPEIYLGFNTSNLKAVYSNSQGNILPIQETGISFGLGLPVIRDVFTADGKREKYKSMIYLSGEYIKRGGVTDGRVQEDLYRLTLGMSLTDLWFIKRQYR